MIQAIIPKAMLCLLPKRIHSSPNKPTARDQVFKRKSFLELLILLRAALEALEECCDDAHCYLNHRVLVRWGLEAEKCSL